MASKVLKAQRLGWPGYGEPPKPPEAKKAKPDKPAVAALKTKTSKS
jgi:hypothetical protein